MIQQQAIQLPEHFVVTVGRSFGSGGRALGRLLAERLGIDYYDKELLQSAAQQTGLSTACFERHDERTPSYLSGNIPFSYGFSQMPWFEGHNSLSPDSIYRAQCDFIRDLAKRRSCVIIGRTADYVLRDLDCVVNIFVHAPIERCVDRIMARSDSADRNKARALAEKTNKTRAAFYNFYTDKRWGDAASYDLTFDSSLLPLDQIADMVVEYIARRFSPQQNKPSIPT